MNEELIEHIERVIAPILLENDLELFKVTIERQGGRMLIEAFVDKTSGGITIDECASMNKRFSEKIEEENLINDAYVLEVSSTGIDWPLETRRDYVRATHKKVRFVLSEAIDNKQEYTGIITRVNGEQVAVTCGRAGEFVIPIEKIKKAIQIV